MIGNEGVVAGVVAAKLALCANRAAICFCDLPAD
tara:strand:- start:760 stop:861 length:102 start_codon:yes stop_codon:yes gene_type:complete